MKIKLKEYLSFCGHNSILASICFFISFNVSALESVNFEFSRDSQNLVLSFTESHGIMKGLDSKTTIKVYGNGLVKVHYPVFMKKAGKYEMMLDDDALNELLQTLAKKNIPELNIKEAQSEKKNNNLARKSASGQTELFAVYDASITTIEINLDRYTKQPEAQVNTSKQDIVDLKKKITWKGLRSDAKRFPNIESIQNLATAQTMLLGIADSKDLIRSN